MDDTVNHYLLLATTALHGIIAVVLTLYPFLVTTNAYDGIYFLMLLAVVIQWALLDGECILSYVEKRLRYGDCYDRLGLAPYHQWWYASMSEDDVESLRATFVVASVASGVVAALRNTSATTGGAQVALRFGDAASLSVVFTVH